MDARRLDDYLNTLACRRALCIVCIIAPVSYIHTLYRSAMDGQTAHTYSMYIRVQRV